MAKTGSWDWDRVSHSYWAEPSQDVHYLLNRWKAAEVQELLDLGCGRGRHSLLFAEHRFKVTAVDSSESGLRSLRDTARRRALSIRSVRADFTELPFADRSFDVVLAFHSIYHVDSKGIQAALSELRRVLKPAGEVYLTLNSKNNSTFADPKNTVIDDHVRMKEEEDGGILPHYYCDLDDLHNLLKDFNIITLRQVEDIYQEATSWHYFVLAAKR